MARAGVKAKQKRIGWLAGQPIAQARFTPPLPRTPFLRQMFSRGYLQISSLKFYLIYNNIYNI